MSSKTCLFAVLVLIGLRLILLEYPSLIDPTEGRYAFIAQEMALTGDWVTHKLPGADGAIPYLGKPPLHFWATALSFELFGMEEAAARFPSFLALLIICGSIYAVSAKSIGLERARLVPILALSSGLGFITAGTVTVDLTITAMVTLSLAGYFFFKKTADRRWGYLIFAGLALGFLTKGPIAAALFLFPVFVTEFPLKRSQLTASNGLLKLPWVGGIALFFIIVLPWFALCEIENPGFLKYFFWNENILRYLKTEYGDRYGSGHRYPYLSSWWMFAVSYLPWTPFLCFEIFRLRHTQFRALRSDSFSSEFEGPVVLRFFASWMLAPLLVFSFSKQLHLGYIVPALPGACLLHGALLNFNPGALALKIKQGAIRFCLVACVIFFLMGVAGWASSELIVVSLIPLLVVLTVFFSTQKPRLSVSYLTAALALSVCSTLSLALTTFAGTIGERNSTEEILDCRSEDPNGDIPSFTVIGNNNYSAMYYARAWETELHRQVNIRTIEESNDDFEGEQDLLLRTNSLKDFSLAQLQDFHTVSADGRWVWLHRGRVPFYVSKCDLRKPPVLRKKEFESAVQDSKR